MGRVVRPSPITHLRRLPKCPICFFMEGFQRGRAQSWHGPRFYLLKLADAVRLPSAFGPWWACHFPFYMFFLCFFFKRGEACLLKEEEEGERGEVREKENKASGFPAYPLFLQRSTRFKPALVRPLLLGGMVLGPYAGPCLF